MNPYAALLFWLPFLAVCGLAYGSWWVFRVISSGYTARRTEKSLNRHGRSLQRISKGS